MKYLDDLNGEKFSLDYNVDLRVSYDESGLEACIMTKNIVKRKLA